MRCFPFASQFIPAACLILAQQCGSAAHHIFTYPLHSISLPYLPYTMPPLLCPIQCYPPAVLSTSTPYLLFPIQSPRSPFLLFAFADPFAPPLSPSPTYSIHLPLFVNLILDRFPCFGDYLVVTTLFPWEFRGGYPARPGVLDSLSGAVCPSGCPLAPFPVRSARLHGGIM